MNNAQYFSIDEINELVAPYIRTIEESFYAGQSIGVGILAAAHEAGLMPRPRRANK